MIATIPSRMKFAFWRINQVDDRQFSSSERTSWLMTVIRSTKLNIMTMGGRVVGEELAKNLVDIWLASDYQGGRSAPKVERMKEIEKQFQHT
jgi:hypothetical protein